MDDQIYCFYCGDYAEVKCNGKFLCDECANKYVERGQTMTVLESTPRVGGKSPWGAIDIVEPVAEGIVKVITPGHGGYKLNKSRNMRVNHFWRKKGGWYEEDCEWAIVAFTFPECFPPDLVKITHETLKEYFWREYEWVTGKQVDPSESYSKREHLWQEAHRSNYLVVSAKTSKTYPGYVEGYAVLGGRHRGRISIKGGKIFLIPEEEYDKGNTGLEFLINPEKHKELKGESSWV